MRGQLKPGVNWLEIENRIRSGEKAFAIAKDFDISRQAIEKRAKRFGWLRSQKAVEVAKINAKVANGEIKSATKRSATLMTKRNHVQRFDKDTPETKDAILQLLKEGNPRIVSAQCAGVSLDSLNRWVDRADQFALLVRQAESEAVRFKLQNIKKAGDRGDWKADSWYLERTQRQIFGNENNKLGAMNLQINIMRDTSTEPVTIDSVTIDNAEVSES